MHVRNLTLASVAVIALLGACSKPAGDAAPKAGAAAETPVAVKAPSGVYKSDPNHTTLTWTLNHLGISNYTAEITRSDATLTLDAANPTNSKIELTIDPTSVRTNYPGDFKATHKGTPYSSFEEEISKGDGYLNSGKFPTITFKSTSVVSTGPRTADVTGDLTFLGVTKPVTVQAEYIGDVASGPMGAGIGFSVVGKFLRSDFGMAKVPYLGDEVTIRYDAGFMQATPATPAA